MKPVSQPDPLMDDKTSGERTSARRKSAGAKKASADESAHSVGKSVKDEGAKGEEVSIPVDTWKEIVRLAQIGEQAKQKPQSTPEHWPEPQGGNDASVMHTKFVPHPFLHPRPEAHTQVPLNEFIRHPKIDIKAHQMAATIAALRRKANS